MKLEENIFSKMISEKNKNEPRKTAQFPDFKLNLSKNQKTKQKKEKSSFNELIENEISKILKKNN